MTISQQTFLGASVRGFTASLGWEGNSSNIDINLVEDDLNIRPGFHNGDKFTPIDVGLPAKFAISGDEGEYWDYTGLVKNYKEDNSANGSPLYSVSLTDPRELLEGTKLILNNYYGSVSGISNILNVYGHMEDLLGLNSNDPDYKHNYRGSEQTDAGIPYRNILGSLSSIASGLTSQHYGSMLKLKDRSYTLNLNNLPKLPVDYRIPNTDSMSCIDLISDICGTANYDFFVEMSPIYTMGAFADIPYLDNRGNQIHQIDIHTVNRSVQPPSGVIINFINSVSGASVKNVGFEFRNQTVGKFLTGGPLSLVYYKIDNIIVSGEHGLEDLSKNNNDYWNDEIHQYWGTNLKEDLISETIIPDNTYTSSVWSVVGRLRDSYGNFLIKTVDNTSRTITYSYESDDKTYQKINNVIKYTDPAYWLNDTYKYLPKYYQTVKIDTKSLDKEVYPYDEYEASLEELRAIASSQEAWNMYLASYSAYEYVPINLADYNILNNSNMWGLTLGISRYKKWDETLKDMVDSFQYEEDRFGNVLLNGKRYTKKYTKYYHTQVKNVAYGRYYKLNLNNGFATGEHAAVALYKLYTQSASRNMSAKDIQSHVNSLATVLDRTNIDKSSLIAALNKKLYDHLYQFAINYGKKYTVKLGEDELITKTEPMPGGKYRVYSNLKPVQYGYLNSGQIASGISLGLIPKDYINLCDEQGKISAYMKIDDAYQYNLTDFSSKDIVYEYFLQNNLQVPKTAFVKINVEEELAFIDKSGNFGPRVVFEIPQFISHKEELKLSHYNAAQSAVQQITFFNNNASSNFTVKDVTIGGDTMYENLAPIAIKPSFVMIPFESNTNSYGPWWKIGANGAMEYEKDQNLVPWNYNGYEGMDYAALAKVSEVAGVQFDEYGSVEIPNVPSIPLGRQLQYVNSHNNQSIKGPYITDISVDFSDGGFKTTYKMQTWTPSFGKLSKYYSDKITKLTGDNFKNQRLELERKSGGFYKNAPPAKKKLKSYEKHSSANIISAQVIGEISSGQNILDARVVFQPDYNTITQIDKDELQNQAVMSIDGLLRPYTTNFDGSGNIPHFEVLDSGFYKFVSGRHPSLYEYHPFQPGHDVFSIATDYTNTDGKQDSTYLNERQEYHSGVSHRGLALRNPGIVIAGYGRALEDGKPVPNANKYYYDDSGSYSYLASGNENSDLYASGYMSRQDTWKVGPLGGLNWSKREKCWFAGTRLYEGYLIENLYHTSGRLSKLPYTQARIVLLDGTYAGFESGLYPDQYQMWNRADASGTTIAEQKLGNVWNEFSSVKESGGYPDLYLTITNRSTRVNAPSGAYVIAANMPNGEYRAIWIDCESEERDGIL